QCEGYKAIYEEARRQKPHCAMALNWCYNEPWPTAANNSIINYPANPKPAFYAVAQSCRPVLVSARLHKFRWKEGDKFNFRLFILNDKYEKINSGIVKVYLKSGNTKTEIDTWRFQTIEPNQNTEGPEIEFIVPKLNQQEMTLLLEVEGQPEWNSEYNLLYIN
ncbi:MAG: hypothetical protein R3182_02410, partial [Draconibacterium sp.]|nr:hypothetical protein [Draconibacterium sp.]